MSILQVTNFLYLFVLGLSTFFNRPTTLLILAVSYSPAPKVATDGARRICPDNWALASPPMVNIATPA